MHKIKESQISIANCREIFVIFSLLLSRQQIHLCYGHITQSYRKIWSQRRLSMCGKVRWSSLSFLIHLIFFKRSFISYINMEKKCYSRRGCIQDNEDDTNGKVRSLNILLVYLLLCIFSWNQVELNITVWVLLLHFYWDNTID